VSEADANKPTPLVVRTPIEMATWSRDALGRGERIAFVPTMGALHEGHLALMREARALADRVVISIFVNPAQFGPREDLAKYPRDLDGDLGKAGEVGVDVAFVPEVADIYPPGFQTYVQVRELERGLDGPHRPEHFIGVATVVCKLFNLVRPSVAVFGEKDYQQLAIVRRMVTDLDMNIRIVGVATVREPDGLAMSSRNVYLSAEERARALSLSQALFFARARAAGGEQDAGALIEAARSRLDVDKVDYLELVDARTLEPIPTLDRAAVLAVAAFVGRTRLIDNVPIGISEASANPAARTSRPTPVVSIKTIKVT
jgi:pantoate--beta-alanine ligase